MVYIQDPPPLTWSTSVYPTWPQTASGLHASSHLCTMYELLPRLPAETLWPEWYNEFCPYPRLSERTGTGSRFRQAESSGWDMEAILMAFQTAETLESISIIHRSMYNRHQSKGPYYIVSGLAQDCGNSSALAIELPQSCTKPSI